MLSFSLFLSLSLALVLVWPGCLLTVRLTQLKARTHPKRCLGNQSPWTWTLSCPSRVSAKQCAGSWWEVKTSTWLPVEMHASAASTTSRSAPPMPRSGCTNATRGGGGGDDDEDEAAEGEEDEAPGLRRGGILIAPISKRVRMKRLVSNTYQTRLNGYNGDQDRGNASGDFTRRQFGGEERKVKINNNVNK